MSNSFTFVAPNTLVSPPKKRQSTSYLTNDHWKPHKDLILELVYDKRWKLPQVIEYMSKKHNFHANERQYTNALEKWGRGKRNLSLSSKQIAHLLNQVMIRHNAGKESSFRYTDKRGGEKIPLQKVVDYLKDKTRKMQAASIQEKLAMSSQISLGISSRGLSIYTPTISNYSRRLSTLIGSRSSLSLDTISEHFNKSRLSVFSSYSEYPVSEIGESHSQVDSISPSSSSEYSSKQESLQIFSIDQVDLCRAQELERLQNPFHIRMSIALIVDTREFPPKIEVCNLPTVLSFVGTRTMGPNMLMAAFFEVETASTKIVDSVEKLYGDILRITIEQRFQDTSPQSLEQTMELWNLSSLHQGKDPFHSGIDSESIESLYNDVEFILGEEYLYSGPVQLDLTWWTKIMCEGCDSEQSYIIQDSDWDILVHVAWTLFFRGHWVVSLRMCQLIRHAETQSGVGPSLTTMMNLLRGSLCFEALGKCHHAFNALNLAKECAAELQSADASAALTLLTVHESMFHINIIHELQDYGHESAIEKMDQILKNLRCSSDTTLGSASIINRAMIQKLQTMGLGLDSLASTSTSTGTSTGSLQFSPMRNAVNWFLSREKHEYPYLLLKRLDGANECAQLVRSLCQALTSRAQMDVHMLTLVQLLGFNLDINKNSLISTAIRKFEDVVWDIYSERLQFPKQGIIDYDVSSCLESIMFILNLRQN